MFCTTAINTNNTLRRQAGAGRTLGVSLLVFSTEYGERDENTKYFGIISKNFMNFSGPLMLPKLYENPRITFSVIVPQNTQTKKRKNIE